MHSVTVRICHTKVDKSSAEIFGLHSIFFYISSELCLQKVVLMINICCVIMEICKTHFDAGARWVL